MSVIMLSVVALFFPGKPFQSGPNVLKLFRSEILSYLLPPHINLDKSVASCCCQVAAGAKICFANCMWCKITKLIIIRKSLELKKYVQL